LSRRKWPSEDKPACMAATGQEGRQSRVAFRFWVVELGIEGLGYRDASLIRNSAPLGPYRRPMSRALQWS